MNVTKAAKENYEKLFPGKEFDLNATDPEFAERLLNFALDETVNSPKLGGKEVDARTRQFAVLATLLGCQGLDAFKLALEAAFNVGVTPIEIKEIVYQAVDYLGFGRVLPFLNAVNEFLASKGVALPLEGQAQTTLETRLEAGVQAQVDIFGDGMKEFWRSGPDETKHINRWLAENCFGDYYTRKGLDLAERELITFCFISAQGGCEPQLTAHAAGNMNVGNDRLFLIKIVSLGVPYIGYPRSLNALSCVNKAYENMQARGAKQ